MKHTIQISASEILNSHSWETPLHLAAKHGLPIVHQSFILGKIEVDWEKVDRVTMWENVATGGIIFQWERKNE